MSIIKKEWRDLFSVPKDYMLCHCISSDFALGAGVAKGFAERGVRDALNATYQKFWDGKGFCLITNATDWAGECNLVTKYRCFQKPTYQTLKNALYDMRDCIEITDAKKPIKLAMPIIGCGLDKLEWDKVEEIIEEVFQQSRIEILICML